MDETVVLLLLAAVMLTGSYIAGSIPLFVAMSEEKLHLVSVLGAGLLVGTALAVIIPEGMQTLYAAQLARPEDHKEMPTTSAVSHSIHQKKVSHDHDTFTELHSVIGVALVLGFIFMLFIDQCSKMSSRDTEGGLKHESNITATLGLVVHAAADGIALGAAATTSHADVEMIVFIAIMLHKAPAAFGLVTFLLHDGLERNRIRRHLLIFSLAAPLLAIITYFGISQKGKETLSTFNATGIAMLFSAGTFLYVATVHVLPEIAARSGHSHGGPVSDSSDYKGFRKTELFLLMVGAVLPLFLTLGHHH